MNNFGDEGFNSFNDMDDIADMLDETASDMRHGFPELKVHIEGQKTIIQNFDQVTRAASRDKNDLKKFISKHLAVPTHINGSQLEIGSKIRKIKLTECLDKYAEKYIICSKCGKPDTRLNSDDKSKIVVHCLACGHQQDQPRI